MSSLASPYKIVTLPINCDTLILTFSPHHDVVHKHFHILDQVGHTIKNYQQTHRICLVAETFDFGIQISKRIKQLANVEEIQTKKQIVLPSTPLKLLSQNLQQDKENISFLPNFKSTINKIDKQVQYLDKQKVKKIQQSKKSKAKALKIKEKELNELQRYKKNIKKQMQDRVWFSRIHQKEQQDSLLRWLEQDEQEEQMFQQVLI